MGSATSSVACSESKSLHDAEASVQERVMQRRAAVS